MLISRFAECGYWFSEDAPTVFIYDFSDFLLYFLFNIAQISSTDSAVTAKMSIYNNAEINKNRLLVFKNKRSVKLNNEELLISRFAESSAESTKTLSAIGSKNLPKFVINLYFLARNPSKKSVKLATAGCLRRYRLR